MWLGGWSLEQSILDEDKVKSSSQATASKSRLVIVWRHARQHPDG
jgi:hypothetical protein